MEEVSSEEVKVLGTWVSPFALRVVFSLNLKKVKFEFLEEVFGMTKSELLLKSNPVYKKIPVFFHRGKPIAESLIIVQYIDEVWASSGPSILPSDAYDRAVARFWAYYIDDKFFPALFGILKAKTDEAKAAAAKETIASLVLLEDFFANSTNGKPFFGGDTVGFVDFALGSYLGWIVAAEDYGGIKVFYKEKTPRLVEWAERFRAVDEVKKVLPEDQEFVVFSRKLQAKWDAQNAN